MQIEIYKLIMLLSVVFDDDALLSDTTLCVVYSRQTDRRAKYRKKPQMSTKWLNHFYFMTNTCDELNI